MKSDSSFGATSSKTVHRLSALSLDCLERVLWYDGDNSALRLFLTGDKPLLAKLQRSRVLSVKWISSAYLDWTACQPLLKQLPQLQSLRLTTWSPTLLCLGLMEGEVLPSSLTSLSMNFGGVFSLLNTRFNYAASLFGNLSKLDSLTMVCKAPQGDHEGGEIDIAQFPSSLRSLSLTSFGSPQNPTNTRYTAYYHYSVFNIRYLPPNLETLVLNVVPAIPNEDDGGIQDGSQPKGLALLIGYGIPGNLSFLTNLSVWLTPQHPVDLRFVAANLKRLEALGGFVQIHLQNALLPKRPIHSVFPRLQALRSELYKLSDWNQLEDLPPTLTELGVSFTSDFEGSEETLSRLNTAYTAAEAQSIALKHAAPMGLRYIEDMGPTRSRANLPFAVPQHLLPYFPNAFFSSKRRNGPITCKDLDSVPKNVSQLTFESIKLSALQRLPPSVVQLDIYALDVTKVNMNNLASLNLTEALRNVQSLLMTPILPIELVPHLSTRLEHLSISGHDETVLQAITDRGNAGHLPNLTSLALSDRPLGYRSKTDLVELSMATIPKSVQKLVVMKSAQFSKDASLALHLHPSLTDLSITPDVAPLELLPQLPATLRVLHVTFSPAINLAVVEDALAIMQLKERVPRLKSLFVGLNKKNQAQTPFGWIDPLSPLNRPRVSVSKWLSLPYRLKMLYVRAMLPGSLDTFKTLSRAFAYASLPSGLSTLQVAYPREKSRATSYDLSDITNSLYETIALPAIKYQLPLIGTLMGVPAHETNSSLPRSFWRSQAEAKPFPRHISHLQTEELSCRNVLTAIYYRASGGSLFGQWSPESQTPWRSISEMILHLVNISSWLVLAFFMPWGWQANSLLKVYMWSNIIGSAIAFPQSFLLWYKSGKTSPYFSPLGNTLIKSTRGRILGTITAFTIISAISLKGNLALTFALTNTNYGYGSRAAGLFVAFVSYLFRNTIIDRTRGL